MTDLLAAIAAHGLLVNNLFQHDSGRWQANLRSPDHRWAEFGHGATLQEALAAAWAKAREKWPEPWAGTRLAGLSESTTDIFG